METVVQQDETLYRIVKRSQPDTIDENGHPTSALFKQDDGVSVDRDGDREINDIIDTFKNRFNKRFKGLVELQADVCLKNNIAVIPKPTENIYHAEIFENEDKEPLSQLKALILADYSKVVIYDPDVEWTYTPSK